VLLAELKKTYAGDADTLIVEELGLCTGNSRVDVAVINSALIGYEIKSDQDTLIRLPNQIEIYRRILDYVIVVACPEHVERIMQLTPEWFGITAARGCAEAVELQQVRPGRANPSVEPYALVQLLWRDEALQLLKESGLDRGVRSKPRADIWQRLAQARPVAELGRLVRNQLRSRIDWRQPAQTGASGV
jgi:hypothetical protein